MKNDNSHDMASQIITHLESLTKVTPDSENWQDILKEVIHQTRQLQTSEAKWRSLVENSPDLVTLEDSRGNILDINAAVKKNTWL